MSNSKATPVDEIKTIIQKYTYEYNTIDKETEEPCKPYKQVEIPVSELMRLIELVEEEQANYILDRIQDNHKEPTKWVSQQLTEKE